MNLILKFDFQKRKQLRFSEVNYLNYTKKPYFACDNYIFPKTRGHKNKQCTHSTPLNPCVLRGVTIPLNGQSEGRGFAT